MSPHTSLLRAFRHTAGFNSITSYDYVNNYQNKHFARANISTEYLLNVNIMLGIQVMSVIVLGLLALRRKWINREITKLALINPAEIHERMHQAQLQENELNR